MSELVVTYNGLAFITGAIVERNLSAPNALPWTVFYGDGKRCDLSVAAYRKCTLCSLLEKNKWCQLKTHHIIVTRLREVYSDLG